MGKSIAGVIVGYLVMAILVFGALTTAYLGMGADRAFQPGTYDVTGLWTVTMIVVGLVAAIAGGMTCRAIAGPGAVKALAVVVFVLGLVMAVPALTASESSKPGPRTAEVGNMDAMTKAQTPAWAALLNPFIGAAGVMAGSRRKNRVRP